MFVRSPHCLPWNGAWRAERYLFSWPIIATTNQSSVVEIFEQMKKTESPASFRFFLSVLPSLVSIRILFAVLAAVSIIYQTHAAG